MTQQEIKQGIISALNALNNVHIAEMKNVQNMAYAMSVLYEIKTNIKDEEVKEE